MTADGGDSINVLNCGSTSAVSPLPDRTAGYWIIELKDGRIVDLRRRILLPDADAFGDHPGSFGAD